MPPGNSKRWESPNTDVLGCCVHQTTLPRTPKASNRSPEDPHQHTPRMSYSSDVDASRPPPPALYAPLRNLRSAPFAGVVGLLAKLRSAPRHEGCGKGGATPLTAVSPHEDAPEHLLDRNAKDGKQSPDQGHAKAELRPPNRSPRIRFCGSPPLGSCVLAPPSAAPLTRPTPNKPAKNTHHTETVHNRSASKRDRTGVLTCTGRTAITI